MDYQTPGVYVPRNSFWYQSLERTYAQVIINDLIMNRKIHNKQKVVLQFTMHDALRGRQYVVINESIIALFGYSEATFVDCYYSYCAVLTEPL